MSRKDRRHDPETAERVTSIIEAAERAAAALIDKADANAKRYLAEAEAEADRVAAARLQGLLETADALLAQAEAIRRETLRLLESLRHADLGSGQASPGQAAAAEPAQPGPVAPSRPGGMPAPGPQRPQVGRESQAGQRGKHLAAVPGPAKAGGASAGRNAGPAEASPPEAGPFPPQAGAGQPQRGAVPPQAEPQRGDAAGARLLATQMAVSGSSRQEIEARLRSGFEIEDPGPILDAILGPED